MALIGNTNEEKIWNYFIQKDKIGNAYGVAGLMGNIKKESNFNPKNMENSYESKLGFTDETYVQAVDNNTYNNFQTDRCGFGICQHTSQDRKTNMWIRSKETKKSIGDLEFQLDFVMWEFNNGYKAVLNTLKNATSVKEASDYVCTKYERPANQSTSALKSRSDAGEEIYQKFYKKENTKEEKKMGYTNSSLVNYTLLSPNCSKPRNNKITKIVIHHMAGNLTVEQCGQVFLPTTRNASSNYGIGSDGRVGMYVEEQNRAWTSGNSVVDNQAITIEVANDVIGGDWHVSDKALAKTIELCADICRRNDIKKLNFTGNRNGNLVAHKFYQATVCPGPYLYSKFSYIANEVNKLLGATTTRSYLMKGDKGDSVKTLQENLNYLGYNCGSVDGDFGAKTDKALRNFQKAYKLTVDGKYGTASKKALEEAVAKKKNASTQSAPTASPVPLKVTASKKEIQKFLNTYYGTEIKKVIGALLVVDGAIGAKSKLALGVAIQVELNRLGAGLVVDGQIGANSANAWNKYVERLKAGSKGIFVTLWQCILVCNNIVLSGGIDGDFGNGTATATNQLFAKSGLPKDASVAGTDVNTLL